MKQDQSIATPKNIITKVIVTAQAYSQLDLNIAKVKKCKNYYGLEPFQLLSEEEIGTAFDESKEAVIASFHRTVGQLTARQLVSQEVALVNEAVKKHLTEQATVMHFDETGTYINESCIGTNQQAPRY